MRLPPLATLSCVARPGRGHTPPYDTKEDLLKPKAQPGNTDPEARPVQYTALELSVFGFRARADAETGWAAWRIIRRENPVLAWAVPTAYLGMFGLLAAALFDVFLLR